MPAPKGNKNAKGNKGGQPTKYKKEYCEQARKLCLLKYTDEKLADFFGVGLSTIYKWKQDHIEFLEAVNDGKEKADGEVVNALLQRALGYSHDDVHISVFQGEVIITPITKHYPPSERAAELWLMNRQKWSKNQKVSGDAENPIEHKHNLPDSITEKLSAIKDNKGS